MGLLWLRSCQSTSVYKCILSKMLNGQKQRRITGIKFLRFVEGCLKCQLYYNRIRNGLPIEKTDCDNVKLGAPNAADDLLCQLYKCLTFRQTTEFETLHGVSEYENSAV
eukprot:GHVL01000541.1.p1 GENE.GHVL01000541.1~~GHVL01000541.1.p1  ORF type:complete len:109 (+),score=2.47 GHVL01000541.1:119-445(+)